MLSRPLAPWPPVADPYTISPPDACAPQIPPVSAAAAPPPSQQAAPSPAQATSTERNASSKVRKPRKPPNAAAGKSTLFWVHTDPQSAGGTKEETLKRIRSHVMSEHNRKKRLENTKRYKSKSFKNLAFQPPETVPGFLGPPRPPTASSASSASSNSRRSSHVVEQIDSRQELVPAISAAAVDYYPGGSVEAWDDSWDDSNFNGVVGYQARQPEPAPPIWTHIGSGAHDPFDTGHTRLTDRMMRHLQNCECLSRRFQGCMANLPQSFGI